MPAVGPISVSDLIRALRDAGFDGPFHGRKHRYMNRGTTVVAIPNPHGSSIDTGLLRRLLRRAEIDRSTWERL